MTGTSRLPGSVATLYAELLEQALVFERVAGIGGSLPGAFVEKRLGRTTYLYWQLSKGEHKWQRYLGPDTPELRGALEDLRHRRIAVADDRAELDRLAAMLLQGGALREEPRVAAVLRLLADLGLFRRGAVLVGTQAYRAFGNVLGVRLPIEGTRTQDIDVAQHRSIAIAAAVEPSEPLPGALAALGFLGVPGLDPREASTSFKVRGRELRVDFLTPLRSRRISERPVALPGLGASAQPLPLLDYLIEVPIPAVVLASSPVLVRVPRPGRFALHKLWVAAKRSPAERAKAHKDRLQARALIRVLEEDRADDLEEARRALDAHPSARRLIERELAATLAE
jgi:hypothetical protein